MRPEDRLARLSRVRAALAAGCSETAACMGARVTVAWYRRWSARPELSDAPRAGRPASCEITSEDARALQHVYLKSNRGRGVGSMTMSARMLASEGKLSAPVCAAILAPRASKHALPSPVRRAFRAVDAAMVAKYRDPRAGQGPNDGISIEGFLRMQKDSRGRDVRPLWPGEREVWDDGSVNVGIVVPWPWRGDPCAERYGVRLGRYQLLLGIDCATDLCMGWRLVVRERDSYRADDIVRVLNAVWRERGSIPAQIVVEGGGWQSERTLDFLRLAAVEPISAMGVPRRKLVEGYFNRLWTALSITLPPRGQVGRFRGEMKKEALDWVACREGRKDPRGMFPTMDEFSVAMGRAIDYLNHENIESRRYGVWSPEASAAKADAVRRVYEPRLAPYAAPVRERRKVTRAGTVSLRLEASPNGLPWDYVFGGEGLYKLAGQKVAVHFDPWAVGDGARILAPDGGALQAICVSPAPDVYSERGFYDPSKPAQELKQANRVAVVEAVALLDRRRGFMMPGLPPKAPEPSAPEPLELPEPVAAAPEAEEATDFAALETAAGVW